MLDHSNAGRGWKPECTARRRGGAPHIARLDSIGTGGKSLTSHGSALRFAAQGLAVKAGGPK